MQLLLVGSALVVGGLLAAQASVNQQLNKAVGTPYGASTVQLSVAALALAVTAAASGMLGAVVGVPDVEPVWLLAGGLASPLYITAGILLFPRLGAVTSVGLFVAGQVFASLLLDSFGWLGVPREPVSTGLLLGAAAVVTGISVVVRAQRVIPQPISAPAGTGTGTSQGQIPHTSSASPAPTSSASPGRAGWVVLGLLAGAVLPVQGAVNARLQQQIDAPLAVGTISFAVATLAISAVLVILRALRRTPPPRVRGLTTMPWWGWLGGFCAAVYVTATFLLIPVIGAAVTVALTVAGQQVASAAIDENGWLGMPKRPLTRLRGAGVAVLLAGSVVVQLA